MDNNKNVFNYSVDDILGQPVSKQSVDEILFGPIPATPLFDYDSSIPKQIKPQQEVIEKPKEIIQQPTIEPFDFYKELYRPKTTDDVLPTDNVKQVIDKTKTLEANQELKDLTEKELLKDNDWFENARTIYEYEEREPWNKDKQSLAKWFLNRHSKLGNNLTNLGLTAGQASSFPDHVKQAWLESLEQYERADPTMRSVGKAIQYGILDPINFLAFLGPAALKLTGPGASFLARHTFKVALRKNIREEGLKKLTKADKKRLIKKTRRQQLRRGALEIGAPTGVAYGGLFNIFEQKLDSEIDPEYEGFSTKDFAIDSVFGGIFGGALYGLGSKVGGVISDAINTQEAKYIKNRIAKNFFKEEGKTKTNEGLSPSSVIDSQTEKKLAFSPEGNNKASLNVLKDLYKNNELPNRPLTAILYGSGKYNTKVKGIPEKMIANKEFSNIKFGAHELPPNRNFRPTEFIDPQSLGKNDRDVVLSQNVLSELTPVQALVTFKDMFNTVKKNGVLVVNGGKQATKKPEISSIVDVEGTVSRKIIDDTEYKVSYNKIEKGPNKGKYEEVLEEVVGVDDGFIKNLFDNSFDNVRVIKKDGQNVFVGQGKKKYDIRKRKLPRGTRGLYDPTPRRYNFKNLFTMKNLKYRNFFLSRTNVPEEIFAANIQKKAAQDTVLQAGKELTERLTKTVQKDWRNAKGKKWKDWSHAEKRYGLAILDQIFNGRRKFFQEAGPERVNYMLNEYKDIAPEIRRYVQENNMQDLVETVPESVLNRLKPMRNFYRKIQEEALKSGFIKPNSTLETQFMLSMGVDVPKTKAGERGLIYKDPMSDDVKVPSDIDLHFNKQYKVFDDAEEWFKEVDELYPERKENLKQFIREQIVADDKKLDELLDLGIEGTRDEYKSLIKTINILKNPQKYKPNEVTEATVTKNNIARSFDNATPEERLSAIMTKTVDDIYSNFVSKYTADELGLLDNIQSKSTNPFEKDLIPTASEGKKIRAVFMRRENIPPVIESFLGAYQDPQMNFINSIYKLKQNIENYKYEKLVRKAFDTGMFPEASVRNRPYYSPILKKYIGVTQDRKEKLADLFDASQLPRVKGIAQPLAKFDQEGNRVPIYVPDEIMQSIRDGNDILPSMNKYSQYYMGYQALSRLAVTALRPAGYLRNYIGAGYKAGAAGNWSKEALTEAHKVFKGMASFNNREINDLMLKYKELGLIGTGTRGAELRQAIVDFAGDPGLLMDVATLAAKGDKKLLERIRSKGIKANASALIKAGQAYEGKILKYYQSMDDVWKIYSFIAEKKRYKAILQDDPSIIGNRSPDASKRFVLSAEGQELPVSYLDDYAAMMVRRHMDNYGEVAKWVKFMRRSPTSDFLAYKTEQVRTTTNIAKTAIEDIKEGARLKRETNNERGNLRYLAGWKRLGSLIGVTTSGTALAGASAYGLFKILPKEEQERGKYVTIAGEQYLNPYWKESGNGGLREIGMPDYAEGSEYIQIAPREKDGDVMTINFSRYNPLAPFTDAIRNALKDLSKGNLTFVERITEAGKEIGKGVVDIFGPTMVTEAILRGLYKGEDEYGRKLVNENEKNTAKDYALRAYQLVKPVIPGIIIDPIKAARVYKGAGKSEEGVYISPGGFEKYRMTETLNHFGGAFAKLQPKASLRFKMTPILNNLKKSSSFYTDVFRGFKFPEKQEIIDGYLKALEFERKNQNELRKVILAAYAYGMTPKQIRDAITSNRAYESKLNDTIEQAIVLNSRFIPSTNPQSEKVKSGIQDLIKRAKPLPGTLEYTTEVIKELEGIKKRATLIPYEFSKNLEKRKED